MGITNKLLYNSVKNEIFDLDKFLSNKIFFINRSKGNSLDHISQSVFSFGSWIKNYKNLTTIKVEGLEKNKKLIRYFKNFNIKDIHLFYSPKSSYSFGWHRDSVTVFLYVLKGKKIVSLKNKKYILRESQGIIIPKGALHKVFSDKNTWALSLGLK